MRLPPLPPDSLSPALRSVHDTIVALMVRKQSEITAQDAEGALIGPFPVMLHFPAFGIPALQFLAAIGTEAKLPPIVRERQSSPSARGSAGATSSMRMKSWPPSSG